MVCVAPIIWALCVSLLICDAACCVLSKFKVRLKSHLRQGLSEPDFYGGFVYKLKKIVGSYNFFSAVH